MRLAFSSSGPCITSSDALERSGHADVIGMKVGDEDPSHIFHRDLGVRKRGAKRGLRFLRVHARVDERVAGRSLANPVRATEKPCTQCAPPAKPR